MNSGKPLMCDFGYVTWAHSFSVNWDGVLREEQHIADNQLAEAKMR